jgi:ABC-type multidrug transport system permease subunit
MLRDALFLARKDAAHMLRTGPTIVWTFIMPIVFFYFIGTITSGSSNADAKDPLGISVPSDGGFLADQLISRLEARGYRVARTKSPEEFARYARRLEIPAGFTDAVLAGNAMKIRFSRTGEDLSADYDRVRIARAVYTTLADLIAVSRSGAAATPKALVTLEATPRMLTLESNAAGQRVDPPSGFEQSVPGTMVMFTLLVMFTSGAVTITIERNRGILRRLASSPMSRGSVVAGKWGARMIVGVIQIAFAMITGSVLFHIRWGPNLPMVILVMLAYGALAASLGMLLGNFGRTEGQVIPLGVIASNLLAGLGGCWWPIEVTPLWAQKLALFLPTGWTMDALHKLVNFGASPVTVIPHVAVSLAVALAAGWWMSRSFRFQ